MTSRYVGLRNSSQDEVKSGRWFGNGHRATRVLLLEVSGMCHGKLAAKQRDQSVHGEPSSSARLFRSRMMLVGLCRVLAFFVPQRRKFVSVSVYSWSCLSG